MATSGTPSHKTLVCGGCGKRFRVSAQVDRSNLKCKDCGSPLRLLRAPPPAAARRRAPVADDLDDDDDAPARPRRKKSLVPVFIALGVSALLVVVFAMIVNSAKWPQRPEEDTSDSGLSAEDEARLRAIKAQQFSERDPVLEKMDALVQTFKEYKTADFPLYIDTPAIFEFISGQTKKRRTWRDLTMSERLAYPDALRRSEPFTARWRQAKLGEVRVKTCDVSGYMDHRWVVVPREFPNGEKDEAWFAVRADGSRPRVRGFRHVLISGPTVVKTGPEPLEAPKIDDRPGFQKLDPERKKDALPATTLSGAIDESGAAVAAIEEVSMVPDAPPGAVQEAKNHIQVLVNPDATRAARNALEELTILGKPAIPVLLNALVGKDLTKPDDVYHCHQVVQALRDITGQRFGFEPQTGEMILTAASAGDQKGALRKWFGWWRGNRKTFEPTLSPQLKEKVKKRKHFKERFGK